MLILIKLTLAHFIGDFLLQPNSWVRYKEQRKLKSPFFYAHILLHGLLVWLLLWDFSYWWLALLIVVTHGAIDAIKLYFQTKEKNSLWFFIDQSLHGISIVVIWLQFFNPEVDFKEYLTSTKLWLYLTSILFLTLVSAVIIRELMSSWTKILADTLDDSLSSAGKYIGMLERLLVFFFVITGNWGSIGFLAAAKSVFRFGDLKEAKDRKLTEYILIGTLLSFLFAIICGWLVNKLLKNS